MGRGPTGGPGQYRRSLIESVTVKVFPNLCLECLPEGCYNSRLSFFLFLPPLLPLLLLLLLFPPSLPFSVSQLYDIQSRKAFLCIVDAFMFCRYGVTLSQEARGTKGGFLFPSRQPNVRCHSLSRLEMNIQKS